MKRAICTVVGSLCLLLAGCDDSYGEQLRTRTVEDALRRVRDFQPEAAPDVRRECLGRLVLDAPGGVEWMLYGRYREPVRDLIKGSGYLYHAAPFFPDGVPGARAEAIRYGAFHIEVSRPAPITALEIERRKFLEVQESLDKEWAEGIAEFEADLEEAKKTGRSLLIEYHEDRIKNTKEKVADMAARQEIDLQLPDSFGYRDKGSLHAYFYRDGRLIAFSGSGFVDDVENLETELRDLMSRYRPRKLYEVPTEPGVCVPYGFIPDDGTGDYYTRRTFRYSDRPGVTYTLTTGYLTEGGVATRPEPSTLMAGVRSATGALAGPLTEGRTERVLGLRSVKLGPHTAHQGGISLDTAREGEPKTPSYSVYTGNDGYMDLQALPFIVLEMQSFTRAQVPGFTKKEEESAGYPKRGLQEEPPPFDESLERVEKLLDNLYLRPTDPPMPELLGLPE